MSQPHWAFAAAVVAALDSPILPRALAELLRQVAPFSYTVMFGYRSANRPIDLYDDFPPGKRKIFVTDYQAGPYLLDPFFLAASRSVAPGLYRLRDLAPDRFYQGEYFRSYYVQTGLAEEIAYFVTLPDHSTLTLSLMRAERPFSQKEFAALDAAFPFDPARTRGRRVHAQGSLSRIRRANSGDCRGDSPYSPAQHLCQVEHQLAGRTLFAFP